MQEENRVKQGFEELVARIVVEQERDRFTARLNCSKKKNQGLKNRAHPNKIDASAV
jgi:hypothetical protein